MCFFFFFQAEDGIRDLIVTGVQTCALPISGFGLAPFPTNKENSREPATPRSLPRPSPERDSGYPAQNRLWLAAHSSFPTTRGRAGEEPSLLAGRKRPGTTAPRPVLDGAGGELQQPSLRAGRFHWPGYCWALPWPTVPFP